LVNVPSNTGMPELQRPPIAHFPSQKWGGGGGGGSVSSGNRLQEGKLAQTIQVELSNSLADITPDRLSCCVLLMLAKNLQVGCKLGVKCLSKPCSTVMWCYSELCNDYCMQRGCPLSKRDLSYLVDADVMEVPI